MSNVIKADFTSTEDSVYQTAEDGRLILQNKTSGLAIESLNPKSFAVSLEGESAVLSRKGLAEFLWMAAYMLDGEQRWCPKELPAINYED